MEASVKQRTVVSGTTRTAEPDNLPARLRKGEDGSGDRDLCRAVLELVSKGLGLGQGDVANVVNGSNEKIGMGRMLVAAVVWDVIDYGDHGMAAIGYVMGIPHKSVAQFASQALIRRDEHYRHFLALAKTLPEAKPYLR